jgi:hypothetical protein
MNNDNNTSFEDMSYYDLLQQIHNGTVDPRNLPKNVRQALVEVLILRGQEQIAISKVLKVTDRTVRRDIKDIWERNAINRDPEFTKMFVGQMHVRAMSLVEMLTRMAHSTEGKIGERSLAAVRAWQSLNGLMEKLRSLGYLPHDHRQPISSNDPTGKTVEKDQMKKPKFTKKDEDLLIKINSMPPMERYRFRRDLIKEAMELAREAAEQEGTILDTPETKDQSEIDVDEAT